jgi:hypothetical protein
MAKSFLFVCGCPRSGTTALWRLLAGDTRIRLGVERYGNRFYTREFLTKALFDKERFFALEPGDTFYSNLAEFNPYYTKAQEGFDEAAYIGDKIPKLYRYLDQLQTNFPDCKTVFIFRNIFDVAASYKARMLDESDNWQMNVSSAISDWNASLKAARAYGGDLTLVDYEKLFMEQKGLEKLYAFLGLEITAEVRTTFKSLLTRSGTLEAGRSRALTALEVKEICESADFETYRQLLKDTVA